MHCLSKENHMKKYILNRLDVSRLHNAEFGQFLTRFFEDFEKSEIDPEQDADFKKKFDLLANDLPVFNRALNQVRASEESKQLALLDKYRGNDVKALRDALRAYRNTRNEMYKKAYEVIFPIINQYKGVEYNNYEEQTIMVNSLVNRLKEPNSMKYLMLLKLMEFVENVEHSNQAFNDLFAHRSYTASQKTSVNVKDLRKKMLVEYKMLTEYVLALANVKEDDYYRSILAIINNGRSYYSDILSRRDSNKKNDTVQEVTIVESI